MIAEFLKSIGLVTGPLSLLAFLSVIFLVIYRETVSKKNKVPDYIQRLFKDKLTPKQFFVIVNRVLLYLFILVLTLVVLTFIAYILPSVIPQPTATPETKDTPTAVVTMQNTHTQTATIANTDTPARGPSPTVTPTLTKVKTTHLVPEIYDCIPDTWHVFKGPLYESPIILPEITGKPGCVDGSEYGFTVQKNPVTRENSLRINREITSEQPGRTHVYLSHDLAGKTGTAEISLYIEKIESYSACEIQDGSCDVDLVVGVGKYPSYSEGQFILYRVKTTHPTDIDACLASAISFPCVANSENWIESFPGQKSVLRRHTLVKIEGSELFIYYEENRIYTKLIYPFDRVFWIGYDISAMGKISAYVTFL